ncbi:MAG: HlyC/CorC family transporter, partial [Magnetococcales bacterium]|nr:HlyC/CorC family transporter [Magnetococcales bacterium]
AMVPRTDILAFTKETTLLEALNRFRDVPHARYLVYENNLDNIIGYVAMKELLSVMAESKESQIDRPIGEYVHSCYIVPNSKRLRDLLKEFKANRQQLAVVIDEYGGTEGIITLEDILEEIVGDYEDEFTQGTRRIKKLDNGQFVLDASMRISELGSILSYTFPDVDDYSTIGGLIYHQLGHVPKVEDAVTLPGARIAVLEMDNHRITRVRFERVSLPNETKNEEGSDS